ncbi:MAG: WhiB family transcriptional regulator [Actinobacteria bacterium ATB1]|nr:WhiB family transcriptional regulator [Actinobacteria bacterium ATB1]
MQTATHICSNCGREDRRNSRECEACAKYRRRTGRTRPVERIFGLVDPPQWIDPVWKAEASCRGTPVSWWVTSLPDDPEFDRSRERQDPSHLARARSICSGCSVAPRCLDLALALELHGIWGGTTSRERRLLATKRITETKSA